MSNSKEDRLLSDEELREKINIALTQFKAKILLSTARDNVTAYESGNNELFDLINTQKRLYTESVVGEDEKAASEASELMKQLSVNNNRIDWRNDLRAEQRQRNK